MSKKKFHLKIIESGWGWEIYVVSKNGTRWQLGKDVYDFECQAIKTAKSISLDTGWELKLN